MTRTIALVSCVSKKVSSPATAEKLYRSNWFLKASVYAHQMTDEWFIPSAKYGILKPDQVIEPYNQTLKTMSIKTRREWAYRVINNLRCILSPGDKVIFLAGRVYRENLIGPIIEMGCRVEIPMEGLSIGKQLSWLNQHVGKMNE